MKKELISRQSSKNEADFTPNLQRENSVL